jgi:superfamily II DNA or RNA helicase
MRLPLPGSFVVIRRRRWRVCRAWRDGALVRLDVAQEDRRLTFLAPFDRPAIVGRSERPRRMRSRQALARLAALVAASHGVRTIVSAIDARVDILPYQLEPALAFAHGVRRVLLADEVGLGKTIQAGLVIAERLRLSRAPRVLLVVPAALRDQWIGELRDRFRTACEPADRRRLDALAAVSPPGDNPWRRSGVWIASIDFLKQPHVLEGLPLDPWDLVVVDEAHEACGDSERRDACHRLARQSRRVLLLTGTPHSGDEARFRRLCALGELRDPLTIFRRTRADLALLDRRAVRWRHVALSAPERQVLETLIEFERAVLAAAGNRPEASLLLLSVLRKRALSTLGALRVSIERRLSWLTASETGPQTLEWLQPRLDWEDTPADAVEAERRGLTAAIALGPAQECSWLSRLRALTRLARGRDSKAAYLAALLARTQEPVVVFTEFRDSLDVLARELQHVRRIAVLHGGQTSAEREQELGRFLAADATALLATDVAGQGLNLQARARWAINLELPWNPARLEQRAGRVDRLGQQRPVHVTLLLARHEAETGLLARLARRVFAARRAVGAGALETALPDERQVAAHLISGPALDSPARRPAIERVRRWERPARTAAIDLRRRRVLASRWRAPEPCRGPTGRAARGRLRGAGGHQGGALLVFSVPLLDDGGALIEQGLVVLHAAGAPDGRAEWASVVEEARRIAARRLLPRARRVARILRTAQDALAAHEIAIADELVGRCAPGELQPGLFDARAQRAWDAARQEVARIERLASSRRIGGARAAEVSAGRPVLELILG